MQRAENSLSRRSPWLTVSLCFAVAVLEGFDIQALGLVAPRLAPELGLGAVQMGWLFAVASVGILVGAAIGGRVADRVGRKPVFAAAVAIFGTFTVAMTWATSFEALFVLRAIAGLGFGAALPNMMALAIEISPPARRAFTAAAMFCGLPLGGAVSALMAEALPAAADWRVLFYIGGILPLVLLPAILGLMPETYRPLPAANSNGLKTSVRYALFAEQRAKATLLIWAVLLPTMLMLYLMLNWLPTLIAAQGLDRSVATFAALAFNLGGVFGGLAIAPLVDRLGFRWPITLAFTALIGVFFALSFGGSGSVMLLLSGLGGFLLMGANYAFYGVAAACYPMPVRGTGSGAAVAVGRIASVIGPLLAGVLLGQGAAAGEIIVWLAPCAALAALATFALAASRSGADR